MMNKDVYIALLDSGCRFETYEKVSIKQDKIEKIKEIHFEHGNIIGDIIKDKNIYIYDIQIFHKSLSTNPICVYNALKYLLDKKIDIINMSLGFKENYKEIEDICRKLIKKGVSIVCSYPRRSEYHIYPASYDDIIKVTSEGRCSDDKIVALYPDKLFFGANPFSKDEKISGSSIAAAKFTREFSYYLKQGFSKKDILEEFSKRNLDK